MIHQGSFGCQDTTMLLTYRGLCIDTGQSKPALRAESTEHAIL
jgi:hypothetical protein